MMSTTQGAAAATPAAPSISTFLTNVHLLDLDRRKDWPTIKPHTFTRKNTLENERARIRCVEWALYRLFEIWDTEETNSKLQPFFPALEPLQSLNLRAALFRWLNELKKNDVLGKEVMIRKTMFDDCKGEKLQELLASFSTLVLRKVLADGQGGKRSIAGRLAIAKRVTVEEHQSFLPLAIAHRASLTALLRRKRDLRARYERFGEILDVKEQELDQRFESIVKTQEYLDANPIPDHAVSRVSKLFEKNWKGDPQLVEIVAHGEQANLKDGLLDEPFSEIWPKVSEGTFNGSTELSSHGILADLEKRITSQQARLDRWKEFKEAMHADTKSPTSRNVQSVVLPRAKSNKLDLQEQKDLVFSPRKSPRKSEWGAQNDENLSSPTPVMPRTTIKNSNLSLSPPVKENLKYAVNGESRAESEKKGNALGPVPRDTSVDESNSSGFSEISQDTLHYGHPPNGAEYIDNSNSPTPCSHTQATAVRGTSEFHLGSDGLNSYTAEEPAEADEDDYLANQIVSMTLNAAPTPVKPKLSLAERARQSIIASSSPSKALPSSTELDSSTPSTLPPLTENQTPPIPHHQPPTTLLERTRESMSFVPPKPRPSTTHTRRTSKIYPTNQFDTPRKQTQKGKEFTPPEELFSPGAGYDSVFKSRPKVGFSPVGSPVLGSVEGNGDGEGARWMGEGSPSGRRGMGL